MGLTEAREIRSQVNAKVLDIRTAASGGRRRRFAHSPQTPKLSAAISTQAGMASPRKRQSILAHSPEPVSTLARTSVSGNTLSMKSSEAPQAGTLSGGRL